MKRLWKRYDLSIISAIFSIILVCATAFVNFWIALAELVVFVAISIYFIYSQKTKRDKLFFQIEKVSHELDFQQGKAFENLGVACTVVDEDGKIVWLNETFKKSFNLDEFTAEDNISDITNGANLKKLFCGTGYRVQFDDKSFSVHSSVINIENENVYLLYFFDETRLRGIEKQFYDSRTSVMLTVLDNSQEIYQNFSESECTTIFSTIEKMISDWAFSYGALCRKLSSTRMLIFVEEKNLRDMINDKFKIVDKIREFEYNLKQTGITISVGVGKSKEINECADFARLAIDMAQSRGGDQVSIKTNAEFKFFGGLSEGKQRNNKVHTRLMAKTMAEIIKSSDNVLIMGHKFSDFDSVGSAIGMYKVAKHFDKDVKIVVNSKSTLALPLLKKFTNENGASEAINPHYALDYVRQNTLLIVVDTHKKGFCDCNELLDEVKNVVVIDHHRKSVDFIEETVMFYHMPNSSSACEMVTELIQYIDTKIQVDSNTATALFAGIVLDTRNFIMRSSPRTFEAAAYLKNFGANTVEVKKLFATDLVVSKNKNDVINSAEQYKTCAISIAQNIENDVRLVSSQAADEMLNIDGIKASFVLYDSGKFINISARSFGEINVQLIMEKLGGGGHQSMSACQIYDKDLDECMIMLKDAIDNYFSNLT